ncbi:MAG: methyltransferase domain-containing protein [Chloroflexia bacterium]|nr:methyltransferase domain-containing protein [Chloroflexia bacterium]
MGPTNSFIEMQLADKQIVKERFQKNYTTYNNQAVVQKQIASKLIHLMVKKHLVHFNSIVEIGCGTGFLTEEILRNLKVKQYIINDLTSTFSQSIKHLEGKYNFNNFVYKPGDAELVDFPKQLDAVFSTSTLQWFHNLELFFGKVKNMLNASGIFAFSTFGPDNFKELKATLDVGLKYISLSQLIQLIEADFDIIYSEEWNQISVFQNPIDVLRHIKKPE